MAEIKAPVPPGNLPGDVVKKWQAEYVAAYTEAQNDEPESNEGMWAATALKAANKTLKFADPANHAEAMALEDWKVVRRDVVDGVLKVVTRHGKPFSFAVPAAATKSKSGDNGTGAQK